MSALREAVDDEVDIMIDFHGRTTTGQAIKYIRAVEDFHPDGSVAEWWAW